MNPPTVRVYIDTMVFIYQLFNKTHRYHIKTLKLFQDIENQKFMGVTSSLTRSEYLAVIKREVANQLKSVPGKSAIDTILKRFDDFIESMGIELYDSDDLANADGRLFIDCSKKIEDSVPILGKGKKWRVLNGADSIHLVLAERCRSHKFATNDEDFKGISSSITPLILRRNINAFSSGFQAIAL